MYRLTSSNHIVRISDSAAIPADPDNGDYAAYQKWLAAGNAPAPYVQPDTFDADLAQALKDFRVWRRNTMLTAGNIRAEHQLKNARGSVTAADLTAIEDGLLTVLQVLTNAPQHANVAAAIAARNINQVNGALTALWATTKAGLPAAAKAAFAKADE